MHQWNKLQTTLEQRTRALALGSGGTAADDGNNSDDDDD
jgi:hypothetical protein